MIDSRSVSARPNGEGIAPRERPAGRPKLGSIFYPHASDQYRGWRYFETAEPDFTPFLLCPHDLYEVEPGTEKDVPDGYFGTRRVPDRPERIYRYQHYDNDLISDANARYPTLSEWEAIHAAYQETLFDPDSPLYADPELKEVFKGFSSGFYWVNVDASKTVIIGTPSPDITRFRDSRLSFNPVSGGINSGLQSARVRPVVSYPRRAQMRRSDSISINRPA
ncbi:MAG: hypothetical protein EBQ96_07775 [Proteobacteria bacterium]|nr:hypothetical protein [Pseudomonadota bacterium]